MAKKINFSSYTGERIPSISYRGETSEILRFFKLNPLWMANDLLTKSKLAAIELGSDICTPGTSEYHLLKKSIPHIAHTLGLNCLQEHNLPDDFDIRHMAMSALLKAPKNHKSPTFNYLTRDIKAGNPIGIALDIACPPTVDSDWGAANLRYEWNSRGYDKMTWSPELIFATA